MTMNIDKTFALFDAAMRGVESSHRIAAHNIANLSTPGYRAREVPFEEILAEHIDAKGDPSDVDFDAQYVEDLPTKANGNNVVLEREWMNLEVLRVKHDVLTRAVGSSMRGIMSAIRSR